MHPRIRCRYFIPLLETMDQMINSNCKHMVLTKKNHIFLNGADDRERMVTEMSLIVMNLAKLAEEVLW